MRIPQRVIEDAKNTPVLGVDSSNIKSVAYAPINDKYALLIVHFVRGGSYAYPMTKEKANLHILQMRVGFQSAGKYWNKQKGNYKFIKL